MAAAIRRRAPRDGLFRGVLPFETRADGEGGPTIMTGHFTPFDQWTEINSMWEGNFLERMAVGSMKKTMRENRDFMQVLFQHGRDMMIGDKPLGVIDQLAEDDYGAAYDVRLLATGYVAELIPGLREKLYGASFRFSAVREEWVNEPKVSEYNPQGLPERTIREASVSEFGPVTFPAYRGASAGLRSGMRSLSDEMLVRMYSRDPDRVREMLGIDQDAAAGGTGTGSEDGIEDESTTEAAGSTGTEGTEIDPAAGRTGTGETEEPPAVEEAPRSALRPLRVIPRPTRYRQAAGL